MYLKLFSAANIRREHPLRFHGLLCRSGCKSKKNDVKISKWDVTGRFVNEGRWHLGIAAAIHGDLMLIIRNLIVYNPVLNYYFS